MRAAWVVVAVSVLPVLASAQSPLDDPRRRAYVVPFARRATDCLAAKVAAATDLVDIVRGNRVRDALAEPFKACADEVDDLIAAYDRAYFPGAGEQFFRGAYLSDLPRAIQQRVQKEVERREQEAARSAAEAAQRAASEAEQRKANEALAARLWAENDRKQVAARQAQDAAPARSQPTVPPRREIEVASDPRVRLTSNAEDTSEQSAPIFLYGVGALFALVICGRIYSSWRRRRDQAQALASLAEERASNLRKIEEARKDRLNELKDKYADEETAARLMAGIIWQGMTVGQLLDARGLPVDIDTDITPKRTREIYKYDQIGANRYKCRVMLDDGIVVRITERGA